MTKRLTINPVTRISGFLEIQVEVQNNTVVNAWNSGLLFRGFEAMLKGRPPLDAIYFTERICGICSTAHAMASTLALEEALGIIPSENARMVRDFIHGCEFLQNHLRHFYQYTLPDYVHGPEIHPLYPVTHTDYRLPEEINRELAAHYLQSVQYSRKAHEMLATLGGKAPHNHGIFVGGVTVNLDAAKWIHVKSLLFAIREFAQVMVNDVYQIARFYPDYFTKGMGPANFMSYGLFDHYADPVLTYVRPKVLIEGTVYPFDPAKITENVYHAWYQGGEALQEPGGAAPEADLAKATGYSWVKAPRYDGHPVEVGPLARMWLSGEYTNGISAMDRTIARVLEVVKLSGIMAELLERMELLPSGQRPYVIPEAAKGVGLIDTTRGALGHWLSIEAQRLHHYDIITPSAWNMSPTDSRGMKGVGEEALIGTVINDLTHPVEIGRVIRSFDPCISCATHLVGPNLPSLEVRIL